HQPFLDAQPYVILTHHTARAFRSAFRKTGPCRPSACHSGSGGGSACGAVPRCLPCPALRDNANAGDECAMASRWVAAAGHILDSAPPGSSISSRSDLYLQASLPAASTAALPGKVPTRDRRGWLHFVSSRSAVSSPGLLPSRRS